MKRQEGTEMRCQIKSLKLNCGCCDEVMLECDLEHGHIGMHHYFVSEKDHTYKIVWTDVSNVSRETYTPPAPLHTDPQVDPDFHW